MSVTVLVTLYDKFDGIIDRMGSTFTSHEFITTLAQAYQVEYIEALFYYSRPERPSSVAPFREVHKHLAKRLKKLPQIRHDGGDDDSINIFNHNSKCASWKKIFV